MLDQQSSDVELAEALGNARYATLAGHPATEAATTLVDSLAKKESGRRQKSRSSAGLEDLRKALGGFIADLLFAHNDANARGFVYRPLSPRNFTGGPVSHRVFTSMVDALEAWGLLERVKGFQRWTEDPSAGARIPHQAFATRFRATAALLSLCQDSGIDTSNVEDHFHQGLPEHPLVLKGTSRRNEYGRKVEGKYLKFDPTPRTEELEGQIIALNKFLDGFDIRGGRHRGFIRGFNNGDQPDFDWNKGGRLYSQPDTSYQQLSKEDRLRMTINGEPVVEVDIRASYLTILHALCHRSADLPEDPYAVPSIPRDIVKMWVVPTLGFDGHLKRWPPEMAKEFLAEHGKKLGKVWPLKKVRESVTAALPLLKDWGTLGVTWADLMYLESEAVLRTMLKLMAMEIPSLPVHDSLIVPRSAEIDLIPILKEQYRAVCGVEPKLKRDSCPIAVAA